jgi:hypothetical protein
MMFGGELDSAVDVEPIDGLDQADASHLDEVLELLAAIRVAARQRADERQVLLDEPLTRRDVPLAVVAAEELSIGRRLMHGHVIPPAAGR